MIEIVKAPPFATVQDLGWPTGRAWGLPPGGAMDRGLLTLANLALGNRRDAAAIEWALGPGVLRAEQTTRMCVLRSAEVRVSGGVWTKPVIEVPRGGVVEIVPNPPDRFLYVAVAGGIAVPPVLGSRSTYLPGGFGGLEGRRLKAGDKLPLGPEPVPPRITLGAGDGEGARSGDVTLRVTRGPQWDRFDDAARELFLASRFTVSPASDRMGYRLSGPAILPRTAATLPSEAACPGAIQIPDDGQPIVLMPDGPTVGGYPKLGVVTRADLRLLAQCQPGRGVRFKEVAMKEARAEIRQEDGELGSVEAVT